MLNTLKSAALALACAAVATVATAAIPTTHYNLNKPQVGADSDQWGTYVNGDLDVIDSTMFSISGVANAACPKAGCTFTGGITGTTASFSGASSFGSTLGVTGLATLGGGASVTGNVSVTGASTVSGVTKSGGYLFTTFNAGSPQTTPAGNGFGAAMGWNYTSGGAEADIWSVDNGASECLNVYGLGPSGAVLLPLQLSCGGNLTITGILSSGGLISSNGLSVTAGPVSLPAASITNGFLDTVATAGTCTASATTACGLTINAQGRVISTNSATIQSDTCGSNANGYYCRNSAGYIHEWGETGSIGSGGGQVTQTLPLTCPTSIAYGQATSTISGTNGVHIIGQSQSSITIRNDMGNPQQVLWTADCN